MNRFIKFTVPVLALGLFAFVPSTTVRADDPPAPSAPAATGSITIKVVDADGKVVAGIAVQILPPEAAGAARGTKPTPLAEGKTDDNGLVTLKDIAVGKYSASARNATGMGRADVTIAAGAAPADPVVVTLKAGGGGRGGRGGAGGGGNTPPAGN